MKQKFFATLYYFIDTVVSYHMKYIVAAIISLPRQSSLFHPLYTPGTFFLIKKQICHRLANKCSNSPLPTLAQRSTAAVGTGEAQSLSLFQKTTSQSRYLYNDGSIFVKELLNLAFLKYPLKPLVVLVAALLDFNF